MAARRSFRRRPLVLALAFVLVAFLLPLGLSSLNRAMSAEWAANWYDARRDSTGLAPDAATTQEAVLQVYAARTYGWRGAFGVHTWFALKPAGAKGYTRVEVIGWRYYHSGDGLRVRNGDPDGYWFGSRPQILLDRRGPAAERLIDAVLTAAERYPHRDKYRVWPGPNSNTFTAFVAREVPELRLDLPPNAIGKDYLPDGALVADVPSGTGKQVSLFGLLGVLVGEEEGIEVNLLGFTFGIDLSPLALKLPGLGRVGGEPG